MNQSETSFQKLVEKEVALRVKGKADRAAKTPRRLDRVGKGHFPRPFKPMPTREQMIDNLLSKSKKNEESGCIEWQRSLTRLGYPSFNFGGETLGHRVMYICTTGSAKGRCVLHRCDNRKCINPDHLFLGTQRDNVLDCCKKNRHGSKKVTREDAEAIRRIYESRIKPGNILASHGTTEYLSSRFGVCADTIRKVLRGWIPFNRALNEQHLALSHVA